MESGKLIKIIEQIVKKEVKKVLTDIVVEVIENNVNKVLAEKFVQSLSANQEIVTEKKIVKVNPPGHMPDAREKQKSMSKQRREERMKKMGVENNSYASMIFEGVDEPPAVSMSGEIMDDDDEGIDLSQFGLG